MSEPLKMVISRGKVTFSSTTSTRCSTWTLLAGDNEDKILDVMEDILREQRPHSIVSASNYINSEIERLGGAVGTLEDEIPVSDGVAFQPPKHTTLGGIIELGPGELAP